MKRILLLAVLLLAACGDDKPAAAPETTPATTAAPSTTVPAACRTALDTTDDYIVSRKNPPAVIGLCRDNPATPAACVDAMRAASRVSDAKTTSELNAAADTYRPLATLCRQKLS